MKKIAKAVILSSLTMAFCSQLYAQDVDPLINDAKSAIANNDLTQAVNHLLRARQIEPENINLSLLLANTYLASNDPLNAKKALLDAKRLGANWEEYSLPLAKVYLLQKEYNKLLAEIIPPDNVTMNDLLIMSLGLAHGHAYMGLNKYELANKQYDIVLQLDAKNTEAQLGKARVYVAKDDLTSATNIINEVLLKDKDNTDALAFLGELKRRQHDYDAAQELFEKAIAIDSSNFSARLGICAILLEKRDIAEFNKHVNVLYKQIPLHPRVSYFYALAKLSDNDIANAKVVLEQALKQSPNNANLHLLIGKINYVENDFASAKNHIEKFIAEHPKNLTANKLYAVTMLRLNEPNEAIKVLEPFHNLAKNDFQYLTLLGSSYILTDNLDLGLGLLKDASEIAPDVAPLRTGLALGYIASNNYNEATKNLQMAISLDNHMLQSDALLVYTYLNNAEITKAIAKSYDLVEKEKSALAYNLLGLSLGLDGDYAKAKNAFDRAIDLDPKFYSAYLNLAEISIDSSNLDTAGKYIRKVLSMDSKNERAHYLNAMLALENSQPELATEILNNALNLPNATAETGIKLVQIYLDNNDINQALFVAKKVHTKFTDNPRVLHLLGGIYLMQNNYAEAVKYFEELTAKSGSSSIAWHYLAKVYLLSDKLEEANFAINKALSISPNDIKSLILSAKINVALNNFDEALKIATKVQSLQPKSYIGDALIGDIYFQNKDFKQAAEAYTASLNYNPDAASVIKNLYYAKIKINTSPKHLKLLEDYVTKHSNDDETMKFLATEYMAFDQAQKAKSIYEELLQKHQDDTLILNNLAIIYLNNNENQKAYEYAMKAYNLDDSANNIKDTYGWVLVNIDEFDAGAKLLEKSFAQNQKSPEIAYHLAYAKYKLGQIDNAKELLQTALDLKEDFPSKDKAIELQAKI